MGRRHVGLTEWLGVAMVEKRSLRLHSTTVLCIGFELNATNCDDGALTAEGRAAGANRDMKPCGAQTELQRMWSS